MGRRAGTAMLLLDELLKLPLVRIKTVERKLNVTQPTATGLLESLVELGILRETTGRQRYRVYSYDAYLSLFPGGDRRG